MTGVQTCALPILLYLNLYKFAHSGTSRSQETHHKVPLQVILLLQLVLQEDVIGIADDILQVRTLLHLDRFQAEFRLAYKYKILVQRLNTEVHRLWLVGLNQVGLLNQQVSLIQLFVSRAKLLHGIQICRNRVLSHVALA